MYEYISYVMVVHVIYAQGGYKVGTMVAIAPPLAHAIFLFDNEKMKK